MDKYEINMLRKQSFFQGLPENFKIMFAMTGQNDVESCIENMKMTESQIISSAIKKKGKCNLLDTIQNSLVKNNKKEEPKNQKRRFCHFHKPDTHNDNDCLAQKTNRKTNFIADSMERENSINNIEISQDPVIFNEVFNKKGIEVLLDSGTQKSFISEKILTQVEENLKTKLTPFQIHLADRTSIKVNESCSIEIQINNQKQKNREQLYILPDSNYDILESRSE